MHIPDQQKEDDEIKIFEIILTLDMNIAGKQ